MTAELYSPRLSVGTQGLEPLGHELEAEWLLETAMSRRLFGHGEVAFKTTHALAHIRFAIG